MPSRLALLLGLALGAAGGCSDDDDGGFVCVAGDTRECLGPGACQGAQECREDRSGFQACECDSGEGGAGPTGEAGSGANTAGGMPGMEAGGAPGTAGSGEPPVAGGSDAGGAPAYECDPVGNVGCAVTQNCSLDAGEPACVDAGAKTELEVCAQTSECAPGLLCHLNNCVTACAVATGCESADPTIGCRLTLDHSDLGLDPIGGCVSGCDPLAQNCAIGACYLGACMTSSLGLVQGQPCGFPNECAQGLECLVDLTEDGQPDCSPYCSTAAQDPCGDGLICFPLNQVYATAPATWGVCAPDPG